MRRFLLLGLAVLVVGCGTRSTDHWLRQLKDPDLVKRRQAIRELGARTAEGARAVPALTECLHDDSEYVRHDAITALGKFGSEARPAVPALVAALKDRDLSVRKAAGAALKRIDPAAAAKAGVR